MILYRSFFHTPSLFYQHRPIHGNNLPAAVKEALNKLPPPAPIPGTESWGEHANPFVVVPLPQLTHASRTLTAQDRKVDALVKAVRDSLTSGGHDGGQAELLEAFKKNAERIRTRLLEVKRNQILLHVSEGHLATMKEIVTLGEGMSSRTPRTPRSADRAGKNNLHLIATNTSPSSPRTPTLHLAASDALKVPTLGSPLHELLTGVFSPLNLELTAPW